jgi:polysaccharide export outer membrane protein
MFQKFCLVLGALLILGATGSWESSAWAQPASPPPAITSEKYIIGVDDVLEVRVLGEPEFNQSLQVLSDGTVDYPLMGTVNVVGMTLGQFKTKVVNGLKKRFVRPIVSISVRARTPEEIKVFGSVASGSRSLPLRPNWRVRDVLAAVGGVAGEAGVTDRYELYRAYLLKAGTNERKEIDLYKLFVENDESQNYSVASGDTLDVRSKSTEEVRVLVLGEITRPGNVQFPRNASLVDVITQAGGPTERAAMSRVEINRNGKTIVVDMRDYAKTGFVPPEKVQLGDTVIVPKNKLEYYMFGSFGRSGNIIYPEDRQLTIMTAIAEAGGKVDGMELKKTRIVRRDAKNIDEKRWEKVSKEGVDTWVTTVDVEKMLKTGERADDIAIYPGDEVWVQQTARPKIPIWQSVFGIATAIGSALFLWQQLSR